MTIKHINAATTIRIAGVTVGIEQIGNATLSAYPNPTNGLLTITGLTPGATIRIYNVVGSLAATYTASDEHITVDLSRLSSGIYYLNAGGRTLKVIRK